MPIAPYRKVIEVYNTTAYQQKIITIFLVPSLFWKEITIDRAIEVCHIAPSILI